MSRRPSIGELAFRASQRLSEAGSPTPRLDADLLLAHVLEFDRTTLLVERLTTVSEADEMAFGDLVARRISGVPVAYLTGKKEFMGLPFRVGPGVLVPRPETELLVEWAVDRIRRADRDIPLGIVDVGTGSGAIALSLAAHAHLDGARIVASDVSTTALEYARLNRDKLGLTERVDLVAGNLIDWLSGPVNIVIANLPYLRPDQVEGKWDISAEPRLALDGGIDGLQLIERLIVDLPRVLGPGSAAALEIDPSQADALRQFAGRSMPRATVETHRDLAGWDRFAVVECR